MFSLRNKRRLMKKSVNLNRYGPFFIIFPLPVMLKFTVHITAVHLFTCVAKAVTSRRSRELINALCLFSTELAEVFRMYATLCKFVSLCQSLTFSLSREKNIISGDWFAFNSSR